MRKVLQTGFPRQQEPSLLLVERSAESTASACLSTISKMSQANDMMDEFRAGVTAALRSWSALRTAVEAGWGGNDSLAKAEDLRTNILEHMDGSRFPPARLTIDDLQDNLAVYMDEEFSVVLEDSSEVQLADCLWRMYEGCSKGDPTLARQVVESAQKVAQNASSYPVKIQSPEHDGEGDDDDDDDDDEVMDEEERDETPVMIDLSQAVSVTSAKDYADQYLFGEPPSRKQLIPSGPVRQLGEAAPIVEEPDVDEDGFAPVSSNTRRRARRKPV